MEKTKKSELIEAKNFDDIPMRPPKSVESLENLGRVRLSRSFFMRDFLCSEISNMYGVPNIPDHPDIAIQNKAAM